MFKGISKALSALAEEVRLHREQRENEFKWIQIHFLLATKQDLENMENRLNMKLSEVKAQVAQAAKQNKEAFQELGTRVADLQKQIDDLIAGNSDPDITDEAFLADLNDLKTTAQQLADIIPNTGSEQPPPPA